MADAEGAPLVIVKGMAGTAKTFYTLASACTPCWNRRNRLTGAF